VSRTERVAAIAFLRRPITAPFSSSITHAHFLL
jgi:hypothetical protein